MFAVCVFIGFGENILEDVCNEENVSNSPTWCTPVNFTAPPGRPAACDASRAIVSSVGPTQESVSSLSSVAAAVTLTVFVKRFRC